jgi:hypothetical protein
MAEQNPFIAKSIGEGGEKSRSKSDKAHERAKEDQKMVDSEAWPRSVSGQPMMKIVMTASELIPTGQYTNVSIGPAQITAFVDQSRDITAGYFSQDERDTVAQALNELAEIVEGDVVAIQRNLVLESLQNQNSKEK